MGTKTRSEMEEFLETVIFPAMSAVRAEAQKEYAHDENNAFGNFERVAKDLHLTREQVLMVYLKKHIDGITAHVTGHKTQREPIQGRIKDAMMYLALLWGMEDENNKPKSSMIDVRQEMVDDIPW
jgi:hypothetical protein